MAQHEPIRKRPGPPGPTREIPDKLYFRIGEVAKLCEVPAYVLRFWESEFPQLKPNKGGTGQRLYRRRYVEMALRVKTLLYDEGYTIAGARQAFKAELRSARDPQSTSPSGSPSTGQPANPAEAAETVHTSHLRALQKELRELHALLLKPASGKPAVQAIRTPRATPAPRPEPVPFPKPAGPQITRKPRPEPFHSLFDHLPEDDPS